jgi:hypothetical protein
LFSDTVGVAIPIRTNSTTSTQYGSNGTDTITNCNNSFKGHVATTKGGSPFWDYNSDNDVRITANSTYSATHETASSATVSTGVAGSVSNVVREAKALNNHSTNGSF